MKKLFVIVGIIVLMMSIIIGKYYLVDVSNKYAIVLNDKAQTSHYIDIYIDGNNRVYLSEIDWFAKPKKIDSEVIRLTCGDYKYVLFYNSSDYYRTRTNAYKETSTIFPSRITLIRPYIVYKNRKTYYSIDLVEHLIWDNIDNIKGLGFGKYDGHVEFEISINTDNKEILLERYSWME